MRAQSAADNRRFLVVRALRTRDQLKRLHRIVIGRLIVEADVIVMRADGDVLAAKCGI
jgi:hypothetical protein